MLDVAVVGGGPVGLVAALAARRAGMRVTVVEPRDGVVDKACGEGLLPAAVALLRDLGVDPVGHPVAGFRYTDGHRSAAHRFAGAPGRGVRRTALSAALIAAAEDAGVERVAARVEHVRQEAGSVDLGVARAGHVIAADGLHSTVRRLVGVDQRDRGGRRFGLRQHFRVAPWTDLVEVHWSGGTELYATPVADDEVGVAVLGPRGTRLPDAIAGAPELADRLRGATPTNGVRGAGPLRQRATARTAGRVLLVGDAAGYVDALTGEGLRVGFEQALAAVDAIGRRDPAAYERAWRRDGREARLITAGLLALATSPLRGAVVPVAARTPALFGAVVERLAR